jgi:hypothetical protein
MQDPPILLGSSIGVRDEVLKEDLASSFIRS